MPFGYFVCLFSLCTTWLNYPKMDQYILYFLGSQHHIGCSEDQIQNMRMWIKTGFESLFYHLLAGQFI